MNELLPDHDLLREFTDRGSESAFEALDQILGPTLANILREHAKRYFDEDLDGLGSEPGDFLRNGFNLWVRFTGRWGEHMGGTTHMIYDSQDWDYGYLFGPGVPCELK